MKFSFKQKVPKTELERLKKSLKTAVKKLRELEKIASYPGKNIGFSFMVQEDFNQTANRLKFVWDIYRIALSLSFELDRDLLETSLNELYNDSNDYLFDEIKDSKLELFLNDVFFIIFMFFTYCYFYVLF